jgi:hypothetical protein
LANSSYQVTAVIPVYNGATSIRRSIESVLAQTYPVAELIVVDDGSTDETGAIVQGFGSRVRYIHQPNSGVATARNRGMREAATEWIALLDHDDRWMPTKLQCQVTALQASPESKLCYSAHFVHTLDGSKLTNYTPPGQLWPAARLGNPFPPSVVLLRRAEALELGGFDERLKGATCEDWDFFVRFLSAYPVTGVPEALTENFIEPGGGSRNYRLMLKNTLAISEGSLLAGLSGIDRAIWRRRIKSTIYHRVALSAREWGDPALAYSLESFRQWPLPGGPKRRFKTLLVELRDIAARKLGRRGPG